MSLRKDAEFICKAAIDASLPDNAVLSALSDLELPTGRLILIAIGKAAFRMAKAAYDVLGEKIDCGAVITK